MSIIIFGLALFTFPLIRYEALIPGSEEMMVEYKGKVYLMDTEEKLFKFMK